MNMSMQNINFTSRSAEIKKADKICRKINNTYPAYSPSKIMLKSIFKKDHDLYKYASSLQEIIDAKIRRPLHSLRELDLKYLYFKTLTDKTKEYKLANCNEFMNLANLACAVNGMKSVPIKFLAIDENDIIKKDIDHIVLAVPLNGKKVEFDRLTRQKDVIIIDPWLGIADYAQNIENRYKDFSDIFKLPEGIHLAADTHVKEEDIIPQKMFKNLREMFPELIVDYSFTSKE